MRKVYIILIGLLWSTGLFAQSVGINTNTPDSSSILDINSADRGVLFPRVSLNDVTDNTAPVNNPAEGLMIYNTNPLTTGGDGVGFYFYNGTIWVKLITDLSIDNLSDADGDTKIQVEESPDEDIIRFDLAGSERFAFRNGRIQVFNSGNNVYIGQYSGDSSAVGNPYGNTAVGYASLYRQKYGNYNSAFGVSTLNKLDGAYGNTAMGFRSSEAITSGGYNTSIGYLSLIKTTTGGNNVALGTSALGANITGSNNTAVGYGAGNSSIGNRNVFLGYYAGALEKGDDKLYIHNSWHDSTKALIFGNFASKHLAINGTLRINDGSQQPGYILTSDIDGNSSWQPPIIDTDTDDQTLSLSGTELTITDGNTIDLASIIPATDTLSFINDADGDTKIQVEATTDDDVIRFTTSGTEYFRMEGGRISVLNTGRSILIGENAGAADNFSFHNNIFVGTYTGEYNSSGGDNVAIGHQAFRNGTSGSDNTAIGWFTLRENSGDGNTAIGSSSLYLNTSGVNNTALGLSAGQNNMGSRNVFIGVSAGASSVNASDNIFIGYEAGKRETSNNRLYIENSSADETNALIYGEFDNDLLAINGTLRINDGTQNNGYLLTSDIDGNATWQAPLTDTLPLISDTDGDTQIQVEKNADEDVIRFDVNGNEAMIIDNDGNVGIGVTPSSRLEVQMNPMEITDQFAGAASTYYAATSSAWQSFKPGVSGELTQITLQISSAYGTHSRNITIYEGQGNTGAVVGTSSTSTTSTFTFSGINLQAEVTYTMELSNATGWAFSANVGYSRGRASNTSSYDFGFLTKMIEDLGSFKVGDDGVIVNNYQLPSSDGSYGQIITTTGSGKAYWADPSSLLSDDLGSHIATQNIELDGNWLSGDGGNEGIMIDNNGKVGIGISTPSTLLHVKGNDNTNGQLLVQPESTTGQDAAITIRGARNGSTSSRQAEIRIENYDNDLGTSSMLGAIAGRVTDATNNTGDMVFYTSSNGSSYNEAMRLTSDGETQIDVLEVGGGNSMKKILHGTLTIGSNTSPIGVATIAFPSSFTSVPTVVVTAKMDNTTSSSLANRFVLTTRNITATGFQLVIENSVGSPWTNNLQIDYIAIE